MIQIKIECLNPGCKIDYKIDEVDLNLGETLKILKFVSKFGSAGREKIAM